MKLRNIIVHDSMVHSSAARHLGIYLILVRRLAVESFGPYISDNLYKLMSVL